MKDHKHEHLHESHTSAAELLEMSGLKKTPFRLELLDLFFDEKTPLTAAYAYEKFAKRKRKTPIKFDRATLFRNLKLMAEKNILQTTEFGTGATFFMLRSREFHHHHMFCVKCETAECIDYCGIAPMLKSAEQAGFSVLSHRLDLIGVCASCRSKN